MPAKFTVYKDKADQFRFNLKAGNGEIIAVGSESYPDKKSALKGIASVIKSSAVAVIKDTTVEAEAPKKPARKPAKAGSTAKAKPAKAKTTTPKPRGRKPLIK